MLSIAVCDDEVIECCNMAKRRYEQFVQEVLKAMRKNGGIP